MFFHAEKGPLEYRGQVVYIKHDWSFDFEPRQICGCSVLIADLELCFHAGTRRASQMVGYHPDARWITKNLVVPRAFTGSLLLLDEKIENGDVVRREGSFAWPTCFDPTTGWVCIGDDRHSAEDEAVVFATDTLAVLHQQQLKALWVRPVLRETAERGADLEIEREEPPQVEQLRADAAVAAALEVLGPADYQAALDWLRKHCTFPSSQQIDWSHDPQATYGSREALSEQRFLDLLNDYGVAPERRLMIIWAYGEIGVTLPLALIAQHLADIWFPVLDDVFVLDLHDTWCLELHHEGQWSCGRTRPVQSSRSIPYMKEKGPMDLAELITRIRATPDCEVYAPMGLPALSYDPQYAPFLRDELVVPEDIREFYALCGGLSLFSERPDRMCIVPPIEMVLANPILMPGLSLEEYATSRGDISWSWYIIAHDWSGNSLTIDLSRKRLGRCYNSFFGYHASPGYCPIIALSFTELLTRLYENPEPGHDCYWERADFVSWGDAYDGRGNEEGHPAQ